MKTNIGISKNEKENVGIDYAVIFIILLYLLGVILQVLR